MTRHSVAVETNGPSTILRQHPAAWTCTCGATDKARDGVAARAAAERHLEHAETIGDVAEWDR
jgi:hypothetical protein